MTLAMLIVAGLPLALAGWSSVHLAERELGTRTGDLHRAVARQMATTVGDQVRAAVREVKLAAAAFRFEGLTPEERQGVLRLVFRQTHGASAVVLLDDSARQAAPAVYLGQRSADASLADRPPLTDEDVDRLGANIPFSAGREVGAAIGPVYVASDGTPRLAVAARTSGGLVLAVELTVPVLLSSVGSPRLGGRGRAFVVDRGGRVVLDDDRAVVAARQDRSAWPLVHAALGGEEIPGRYRDPLLGEAIGAAAQDADLGWAVVVAEPARDALQGARALVRRTLAWLMVALLAAAVLGVLTARAVTRPVRALRAGAVAIEAGDIAHRVPGDERGDELGDLARAFNAMATEVQRWRTELEGRVADKTRELREAQELLLRAQNLAALGQLGAGVAHEINNPLAGLLGMTQILLAREPAGTPLRDRLAAIEQQALRIRDIVENLRRLASGGEGITLVPTSVGDLIDGALAVEAPRLAGQKVAIVRELQEVPPVAADPAQMKEALLQIISNARRAMPDGGTLTVSARAIEGRLVAVRLADTGEGIPREIQERIFEPFFTTKRDWQAKGLGLTLANRIVELHRGRITVDSAPGEGAAFTITLPVMQARTLA
jgi:signal transduction histidine kinase